ncbi:recombinase zinc beta ribbon domain-containing protein [Streptomyces sp. NPDC090499]|uniref:recombinase zinc beta ribbon domain-containing protein n=1 Tax=Streptomyces sp. NPDC090499 TaxID=3365965 RepID=UPI0037F69457
MPRLYGFAGTTFRRAKDDEVSPLREAANRREAGQPYEEITGWMNAEGHRTTLGGEWRPHVLAAVLDHPAIAGLYEDADGNLLPSGGLELISPEQFRKIRQMRPKHQPDADRAPQREYMLSGKRTVCGLCGHALSAAPSNAGSRGHRCKPSTRTRPGGCGGVRINADLLETYVGEHVIAELSKPGVRDLVEKAREQAEREAASLRVRVNDDRERQRRLGEDYAKSRDMSLSAFKAADKELSAQIREAREELLFLEQAARVNIGGVSDLVKWWKHAPVASKRALTFLLLEQIAVYPGGRGSRTVDANRVRLTWRTWG